MLSCTNKERVCQDVMPELDEKGMGVDSTETSVVQTIDTTAYIAYGKSFGMCSGYCMHEIAHSAGMSRTTSTAWGDQNENPPKIFCEQVPESLYTELLNLIDLKKFYNLSNRFGCPDCSDGGAAWIEISHSGRIHRVNYEYGKPPDLLRDLEKKLTENKAKA